MTALTRIEENLLQVLEKGLRDAAEEYRIAAGKAVENHRPVEAAICDHLAIRLNKPLASLEAVSEALSEFRELASWLPVTERLRKLSRTERKGFHIHRIRKLNLKTGDENSLIELATQRRGRPPDGREVAVRALEMHMAGQRWAEIEPQLLSHRRNVRNPGSSIRRQVQLLKSTLKRYAVHIEQLCPAETWMA
jgi:hypothetical protein